MKVAYVLLYYPYPTETFVADEIRRLRAEGLAIDVCALLPLRKWFGNRVDAAPAEYVHRPITFTSANFWRAHLQFLVERPKAYARSLGWSLARGSRSPVGIAKQLVIFLKAVQLAAQLQGHGISLVHSHFAWLPALGGLIVSRLLEVPFTLTAHAYDLFQRPELVPLVAGHAARIVAISDVNRRRLLELLPSLDPARVVVIHCGVDNTAFSPGETREPRPGPVRILSVGRLTGKKGHRVLIQACARLREADADFECEIIGAGPLADELKQTIQSLGLQSTVHLAGYLPPHVVAERLRQADIFALPCQIEPGGDRDGIPVSLMEAMAVERAVVSTPVSGIPELVEHGRNGWLVAPEDPAELARALATLARDASLRRELGRRARQTVGSEFSAERNTRQMAELFRSATGPGPAPSSKSPRPRALQSPISDL